MREDRYVMGEDKENAFVFGYGTGVSGALPTTLKGLKTKIKNYPSMTIYELVPVKLEGK